MTITFLRFEQRIDRIASKLPGMPHQQIILTRLFFFVFKNLNDSLNQTLASFGLNTASLFALAMLFASEGNKLNPSDLSDALISSRANVTRLVDELVLNGWVKRHECVTDRRRIDLTLTPEGKTLTANVMPSLWQRLSAVWSDFSDNESVEFEHALRQLLRGIEQESSD